MPTTPREYTTHAPKTKRSDWIANPMTEERLVVPITPPPGTLLASLGILGSAGARRCVCCVMCCFWLGAL